MTYKNLSALALVAIFSFSGASFADPSGSTKGGDEALAAIESNSQERKISERERIGFMRVNPEATGLKFDGFGNFMGSLWDMDKLEALKKTFAVTQLAFYSLSDKCGSEGATDKIKNLGTLEALYTGFAPEGLIEPGMEVHFSIAAAEAYLAYFAYTTGKHVGKVENVWRGRCDKIAALFISWYAVSHTVSGANLYFEEEIEWMKESAKEMMGIDLDEAIGVEAN